MRNPVSTSLPSRPDGPSYLEPRQKAASPHHRPDRPFQSINSIEGFVCGITIPIEGLLRIWFLFGWFVWVWDFLI